MKKRNKLEWPIVIIIIVAILLVAAIFFIGDKKLDLESDEIKNLYSYLGEVDIYRCGGLITYNDNETTKEDISSENSLCNAYYNTNENKLKTNSIESTDTNSNKIKICKVGDKTTIAANEDSKECTYNTISKEDLNETYKKIYGEDIKTYEEKFQISDSKTCYLEGETYYCGEAETYTYSLGNDATIYRLMDKALKTHNGKITITDYFLKISSNKCYASNNSTNELTTCSEEITSGKKIDAELIKKYGSLYKHTFVKDANENYYWNKSENVRTYQTYTEK